MGNRLRSFWKPLASLAIFTLLAGLGYLLIHLGHLRGANWYTAQQIHVGMTYDQVQDLVRTPARLHERTE